MKRLMVLVAISLVGGALTAQDGPPFGDFVEVELVLVDVVVQDRDGKPILDLTTDDFRLYEDKQPVEISQFTPATASLSASRENITTVATEPLAPRYLVIFVDNLHLHPNSRRRVFEKLSRVLENYLTPRDEVMIATYGGTAQVALKMTRNRRALKNALREQADSGAVSLLASNDERRILEILQQLRFQYSTASAGGFGAACRDVGHMAHSHAQQVHSRVLGTVSELNRFVNSLAGYEGQKMLLHVSDGIPLIAGNEAYRYASELCDGTGINKGIPNATDTTTSTGLRNNYWDPTQTTAALREFDTSDEWARLASHANTYQVSFYTFQAHQPSNRSGSAAGTRTSFDVESEGERNRQDALFMIAHETGGTALLGANDIEPALARMKDDLDFSYQLAFEPPQPGDGRQHQLRVEVDRAGATVRHRRSYRSKPREERVEDRVVSALLHGQSVNPLAVQIDAESPEAPEKGVSKVRVRVRVPLDELVLLPEDNVRRGLFTVFMAVLNGFDQMSPVGRKTVPVLLEAGDALDDFVYTVEVPVRGETAVIAVAVQDQIGAEVSYVRQRVRLLAGS